MYEYSYFNTFSSTICHGGSCWPEDTSVAFTIRSPQPLVANPNQLWSGSQTWGQLQEDSLIPGLTMVMSPVYAVWGELYVTALDNNGLPLAWYMQQTTASCNPNGDCDQTKQSSFSDPGLTTGLPTVPHDCGNLPCSDNLAFDYNAQIFSWGGVANSPGIWSLAISNNGVVTEPNALGLLLCGLFCLLCRRRIGLS